MLLYRLWPTMNGRQFVRPKKTIVLLFVSIWYNRAVSDYVWRFFIMAWMKVYPKQYSKCYSFTCSMFILIFWLKIYAEFYPTLAKNQIYFTYYCKRLPIGYHNLQTSISADRFVRYAHFSHTIKPCTTVRHPDHSRARHRTTLPIRFIPLLGFA